MKNHEKKYVIVQRRSRLLRYGIGLSYAYANGFPVLKEDATAQNINGIWINTPWRCVWLRFRRPSYY